MNRRFVAAAIDSRETIVKAQKMRLIPKNSEYSWALYSVLYFGFFFLDPIESHAGVRVWCFTLLGTAAFLLLYFGCFG